MTHTEQLTQWVQQKHRGQIKKYSGKPYFIHVAAVAAMAKDATRFGYEIGICHDVLEDTPTTANELHEALLDIGYDDIEANYITIRVVELTDVFTTEAYPDLSKQERKDKDAQRLRSISPGAQTVKYCDLIDNCTLVLQYDKEHAQAYLGKKKQLLDTLVYGDKVVWQKAMDVIDGGLAELKEQ